MIKISGPQMDELLEWICTIQQIPSPTFHEENRAAYMLAEFNRLGLADSHCDSAGNVLARWPGGDGRAVLVSAHLDTVHEELDSLPLERKDNTLTGPGVADNATGLASLLALAHHLVETHPRLAGDLWLAANVCEEGLGNLVGMSALLDAFEGGLRACLVLEGLGLGQVCHRGLGVARFEVSAETPGGHSWVDYGSPSAIHELAKVITALAEMPMTGKSRSSFNIGVIHGGTSVNTIASSASFLLDLRAEEQQDLNHLCDQVRGIVNAHRRKNVRFSMKQIGIRPAGEFPASHPLVQLGVQVLKELQIPAVLEIGSTDANIPLSRGCPAICIGLTRGSSPHTVREQIEIEPLKTGLTQLFMLVESVWQAVR